MSMTTLLDPAWDETLDELTEVQRARAREFAHEAKLLARLEAKTVRGDWQAEAPYDSLLLEVAGSCLIGQRAARIDDAGHLVRQLPVLLEELETGRVLLPQARVLIEETDSSCHRCARRWSPGSASMRRRWRRVRCAASSGR
jgi:hypothetical protein